MLRALTKIALPLVMGGGLFLVSCVGHKAEYPEWRLDRVIEVAGRQGIAADSTAYYVSGSTALYRYSKDGVMQASSDDPFAALELPANHIGDIDVYNGEIYAGIETFVDGEGKNIQVAIYDTKTLAWKRSIPWNPASGQVEVCGLAVDAEHGRVWMADWVQGTHLYCYNLITGKYEGKVALEPTPKLQQGILYHDGCIIISCDDGDAEKDEADNLYVCDIYARGGAEFPDTVSPRIYRKMTDFKKAGEIEGLTMDPVTGELIVLSNRGARIILGMPKGFYPGYDHEVHELYVYSESD